MISKKEKKVILISILSLVLVAVIAITSVFIVRKTKSTSNSPETEQVGDIVSNLSNKAIADGKIPYNYNGTYKFNTIKSIEFSPKLTPQEIKALYKAIPIFWELLFCLWELVF